MKKAIIAAAVVAALLTGCSGGADPGATHRPAAAPLPSVDSGDAGRFCAGLVALARVDGTTPAALRTAEQAAYYLPVAHRAAEAAASVHLRCAQYVRLLPRRYRG